jgi:hypothetical protein
VWADTVRLSKSTYFDQHVTVEDRDDHYLVHFNVYVKLDQPLGTDLRCLRASVVFNRNGQSEDVSCEKRSVQITSQEERWSFYFRVPKFTENEAGVTYAVIAKVDGIFDQAVAVWKVRGNQVYLGSSSDPVDIVYVEAKTIEEEDGAGGFRLVIVYPKDYYVNNYDDLPICGFLKSGKAMPVKIDGARSAKRL